MLRSVSLLIQEIADPLHREAARRVRECLATYERWRISLDRAYKRGTTARIDRAIQLYPEILKFLKQASNAPSPLGPDPCGTDPPRSGLGSNCQKRPSLWLKTED